MKVVTRVFIVEIVDVLDPQRSSLCGPKGYQEGQQFIPLWWAHFIKAGEVSLRGDDDLTWDRVGNILVSVKARRFSNQTARYLLFTGNDPAT